MGSASVYKVGGHSSEFFLGRVVAEHVQCFVDVWHHAAGYAWVQVFIFHILLLGDLYDWGRGIANLCCLVYTLRK